MSLLNIRPNSGDRITDGHMLRRPNPALYASAFLFLNEKN